MIQSKDDYKRYLENDKEALFIKRARPRIFGDEIWKFQRTLRKVEYYKNCRKDAVSRMFYYWLKMRKNRLSIKLGFTIPVNVFDEGLRIAHYGTIVVNGDARVGKYCTLHPDVCIGTAAGAKRDSPIIGDHVYIGPGAKLFGKIEIGGYTAIGANSVVLKSFPEGHQTIVGIPAYIKRKSSFLDEAITK
jgi:serine O-acetyltransferase